MQRFFIDPAFIQGEKILILDVDVVHQMTRVLRMGIGDEVLFLDNTGFAYSSTLQEVAKKSLTFVVTKKEALAAESGVMIELFQALPKKPETFELIVQKGTELGVQAFTPITTDFCNRRELHKADRVERIITEAAEQSERGTKPALHPVTDFEKALTENKEHALLFHSRDTTESLKNFLLGNSSMKKFCIFIGPEGGFSPKEIAFAQSLNVPILSLGSNILRTETAAIVACGVVGLIKN